MSKLKVNSIEPYQGDSVNIVGQISASSFVGDGSGLTGVTSYTDADTLDYINSIGVVSSSAQLSTEISGAFTSTSSSLASRTTTLENAGYTTCTGDITQVTAGTGLSGGGTSGAVTLSVGSIPFTCITGGANSICLLGQTSASNPGTDDAVIWYDCVNRVPKISYCTYVLGGVGAWSIGGALNTGRPNLAGAGTQNSGLAFGGYATLSCTEEYNGTSWSAGGALNVGRSYLAGAGTQNSGLAFGGIVAGDVTCTEEYNGTSWSVGGALNVGRGCLAGAGTQNEGLAFGGCSNSVSCTEEYNGTSWSTGGALSVGRYISAGAGTQNEGLAFGGRTPSATPCTEEYNGTSWSTGGALNYGRPDLAGAGTQNAGLAFGGSNPSPMNCTEEYNGTSWSSGGALNIAKDKLAGAGTQDQGLAFGGSDNSPEEYNQILLVTSSLI